MSSPSQAKRPIAVGAERLPEALAGLAGDVEAGGLRQLGAWGRVLSSRSMQKCMPTALPTPRERWGISAQRRERQVCREPTGCKSWRRRCSSCLRPAPCRRDSRARRRRGQARQARRRRARFGDPGRGFRRVCDSHRTAAPKPRPRCPGSKAARARVAAESRPSSGAAQVSGREAFSDGVRELSPGIRRFKHSERS